MLALIYNEIEVESSSLRGQIEKVRDLCKS